MSPQLEKVLAGSATAGHPIKVDMDALWRKAVDGDLKDKGRKQRTSVKSLGSMGEFAVISAWARGKGKKG
jgi:hypothetical protein